MVASHWRRIVRRPGGQGRDPHRVTKEDQRGDLLSDPRARSSAISFGNLGWESGIRLSFHRERLRNSDNSSVHKGRSWQRRILCAVFVDFKTAYDLVRKENLLLKLSDMAVQSNWFHGFFNNRICRVRYNNCYSKLFIKTGLPHGAASSYTLFTIYINDLVSKLKDIDAILNTCSFADDLIVWTESPSFVRLSIELTLNKQCSFWREV
ncbi:reverse transcriptase domain-containing protein [Caerostris extrusa]|uniref:Reverse transcriptase domain-containing protein n=1 Tax=Caerostris extrusa TaxID=172846 RepID=A0AAV4Q1F8_CAEEX|nr:reverse transcriptase domain-containing protein [Caerostris extrusa]